MTKAMEETLEKIGRLVDGQKSSLFFGQVIAMLSMSSWSYGQWLERNNLFDYDHEGRIELIRARLNSKSPLLIVNQVPVAKYAHMGALIREGRELRRTRKMAARFQPMQQAAE